MNQINYTSLFSCAGIGETFLSELGLESAVSNELLGDRASWYQSKYKNSKMIVGDIMDDGVLNDLIAAHKEKGCTLTLMSPPCQDFSNAGSRDLTNPRAFLYERELKFLEGVNDINQNVFIENVPRFLTAKLDNKTPILSIIQDTLKNLGYPFVTSGILDASNFGVPQHRRRAFILASKIAPWEFPEKEDHQITIRDAIGHLPSREAGYVADIYDSVPYWPKRYVEVMRHTPTGCSAFLNKEPWQPIKEDGVNAEFYRTAWVRNSWDEPMGAILMKSSGMGGMKTCHPGRYLGKDENGYDIFSDARPFTIRELLILSSSPENYRIPAFALNNDELIRDVIGECVCPLMERKIFELMPR